MNNLENFVYFCLENSWILLTSSDFSTLQLIKISIICKIEALWIWNNKSEIEEYFDKS